MMARTSGATSIVRAISMPLVVCVWNTDISLGVSGPALRATRSGSSLLPMSCSKAPTPNNLMAEGGALSSRPKIIDRMATLSEWM